MPPRGAAGARSGVVDDSSHASSSLLGSLLMAWGQGGGEVRVWGESKIRVRPADQDREYCGVGVGEGYGEASLPAVPAPPFSRPSFPSFSSLTRSAYRSVFRECSQLAEDGEMLAIITVRQFPMKESRRTCGQELGWARA